MPRCFILRVLNRPRVASVDYVGALLSDNGNGDLWDMNAMTSNNQTPLMLAIQRRGAKPLGNRSLINLLLSRGADPYLCRTFKDLKYEARGSVGKVELEASVNLLDPGNGKRLSRSAADGILQYQRVLNINPQFHGLSAFEMAIWLGRFYIVREILSHKPLPKQHSVRHTTSPIQFRLAMLVYLSRDPESCPFVQASSAAKRTRKNKSGASSANPCIAEEDPSSHSLLACVLRYRKQDSAISREHFDHQSFVFAITEWAYCVAVMLELIEQLNDDPNRSLEGEERYFVDLLDSILSSQNGGPLHTTLRQIFTIVADEEQEKGSTQRAFKCLVQKSVVSELRMVRDVLDFVPVKGRRVKVDSFYTTPSESSWMGWSKTSLIDFTKEVYVDI
ncbi:hypothetical protein QBC35DRAFT_83668 [Podospora australis]|uniref:Ankyrin repeat protein n=1 Tax=Podospora australis TaxID=1536484 RepID=A0AAN6WP83_9PEZI|nr:hypothetical protein QBC35DRAFT_83668 [Podospora australis]